MGTIQVFQVDSAGHWGIRADYFSKALNTESSAIPGLFYRKDLDHARVGYLDAVMACVARLNARGISVEEELPQKPAKPVKLQQHFFDYLRPYQRLGVEFLINHMAEGCILADGMRLGKSIQFIAAARYFNQRTLVICPSHAMGVWTRGCDDPEPGEFAKWWPEAEVFIAEGAKPYAIPESAKVVVIYYDVLHAWMKTIIHWGPQVVGLDEGHLLVGHESRRAKAVKEICCAAPRKCALTGTPMTRAPEAMFNLLDTLCPTRFGYFFAHEQDGTSSKPPWGTFSRVFCDAHQEEVGSGLEKKTVWIFKGSSNLDVPDGEKCLTVEETLRHRLQYMVLRRTKDQVDDQLPDKERQIIDVPVPAKAMIRVGTGFLKAGGKEFRRALDLAADAKLPYCVEVLRNHVLKDEKVIAFCYRKAFTEVLCEGLRKKGILATFVHGDVTRKERDHRIRQMKLSINPGVLCCTIDTTSTAIDLSFAKVSVVCELTWEHHELQQLEERTYKLAGNKQFIQYIIARGTGDELVLRAVIKNLDRAEKVIGKTGDNLKGDLGKKVGSGTDRLRQAILAMRKGKPEKREAV